MSVSEKNYSNRQRPEHKNGLLWSLGLNLWFANNKSHLRRKSNALLKIVSVIQDKDTDFLLALTRRIGSAADRHGKKMYFGWYYFTKVSYFKANQNSEIK